ncbi:MAG: hypothetical protein HC830_06140 [Bacteroidetes bacterium]|nr:hypothetical protein [Bacteroidota bacterium]
MQWLLGPVLAYMGLSNHYKYHMYVPEETYFPFVISGVLAFWLGTSLITRRKEVLLKKGDT